MTAMTTEGKVKTFEETFKSPFERDTQAGALQVLEAIRAEHPASSGWVEETAYVEQLPNGKWRAVRKHAKYA